MVKLCLPRGARPCARTLSARARAQLQQQPPYELAARHRRTMSASPRAMGGQPPRAAPGARRDSAGAPARAPAPHSSPASTRMAAALAHPFHPAIDYSHLWEPWSESAAAAARYAKQHVKLWGRHASYWAHQRRHAIHAWAPAGGASSAFSGAVFNLVAAILGGGLVSLPYLFVKTGWLVGVVLTVVTGVTMANNMTAFVRCGAAQRCDSYASVMYGVLGRATGATSQVLMLVSSIGGMVAYTVIIGDVVVAVGSYFVDPERVWRRTIVIAIFAAFVLPMGFRQDLNALRSTSFLGFLAQLAMIVAVFIQGADRVRTHGWAPVRAGPTTVVDFVAALPLVAYMFSCSSSIFPVYSGYISGLAAAATLRSSGAAGAPPAAVSAVSVEGTDSPTIDADTETSDQAKLVPTDDTHTAAPVGLASGAPADVEGQALRVTPDSPIALSTTTVSAFSRVVFLAFTVTGVMFLALGIYGSFVLGDLVSGNVLKTFALVGGQSRMMVLVTALYGLAVVLAAPLNLFAQRISLHYLVYGPREPTWMQRHVEVTVLVTVCVTVGVLVDDVALLFSFLGAIASSSLALLLPAVVYLVGTRHKRTSLGRTRAVVLVVVAFALAGTGIAFNTLRALGRGV